MAFSPDGRRLVSGARDNTIRLWDVATGQGLGTLKKDVPVAQVMFTPDGSTLCAALNSRRGTPILFCKAAPPEPSKTPIGSAH